VTDQENELKDAVPEVKEFSISNYFRSVTWDDRKSSESKRSSNEGECESFPSPPWARGRQDKVCHRRDYSSSFAEEKYPSNDADAHAGIINSSAIDFLFEIKPCLVAMGRMHIIMWSPLVVLYCLKKLSSSPRRKSQDDSILHTHLKESSSTPIQPVRATKPESQSQADINSQKSKLYNDFLFLPIWKKMPSFSDYLPSPLSSAMNQGKCGRRAGQSAQSNQNSFERILFFSSLIASAMTMLASFSTFFSIEEVHKNNHCISKSSQESLQMNRVKRKEDFPSDSRVEKNLSDSCKVYECNISPKNPSYNISGDVAAYIAALIFSAFIMTDAMYVYEFSQNYLVSLHLFIVLVATKRLGTKAALWMALPISAVAFCIMARQDLNLPNISPGLYFDETNSFISDVVKEWPKEMRTYDDGRGTPWMLTGDTRTGIPFLVNSIFSPKYVRRWVPLPDEEEAVILDIAFPDSMTIDEDKQVYLLLHGINGNSNEGYVADFVTRQVAKGNIVAVMVTRGLGDSPIIGQNILHFARTSDVMAAARALKSAINTLSKEQNKQLILAGVGYSMGAITLANYVARSGNKCDLDVAVGFSGALDTRQQVHFPRSASLWQPFIAKMMRDTFLRRFAGKIRAKFNDDQMKNLMRAQSLIEFDEAMFVEYNNFEGLDEYYSEMGAMGDFVGFETKQDEGRVANVSIPLCMVQSLDDPVGYWGTYHDPEKVSRTGKGWLNILFTRKGGHVGWSLGMNRSIEGWSWMSDVASSYVEAVGRVRSKRLNAV